MTHVAEVTGLRNFTLAFALADGDRCAPTWGGLHPLDDARIRGEVAKLRAIGGEVTVSSGGAHGPYLEQACRSPEALAAAYGQVLDAAESNRLDIDIESTVPVDRVNRAVALLQRERGTAVSYTLRVLDAERGIEPVGMAALRGAARHGVEVTVNPMVMNFPYQGNWGRAMIGAVQATHRQLKRVWPDRSDARLYRMLGVTAMIGRNDTGAVTTPQDARTLLEFARSHAFASIAFWSIARDNGGCPEEATARDTCSGIAQARFAFTELFQAYASAVPPPQAASAPQPRRGAHA